MDINRNARLELVVEHFLYYLSNEPNPKHNGISDRMFFYGNLPVQAKVLFPKVSDETITKAVSQVIDFKRHQGLIS